MKFGSRGVKTGFVVREIRFRTCKEEANRRVSTRLLYMYMKIYYILSCLRDD